MDVKKSKQVPVDDSCFYSSSKIYHHFLFQKMSSFILYKAGKSPHKNNKLLIFFRQQ